MHFCIREGWGEHSNNRLLPKTLFLESSHTFSLQLFEIVIRLLNYCQKMVAFVYHQNNCERSQGDIIITTVTCCEPKLTPNCAI